MESVLGLLFQRKLSSKKPPLTPSIQSFLFPVYPLNSVLKCWHCKHIALGLKALWLPSSQTFPRPFFLLFVLLQQVPKALTLLKNHTRHFPRVLFGVPRISSPRTAGSALFLLAYFSHSTSFSGGHFMKTIL